MYLACGGDIVRLYDTEEYNLHQKFKQSSKKIARDVAWSHNGKYFGIIMDGDDSLEVAHMEETMKPYESLKVSDPTAIAFPNQTTGSAAVGTKDGVVHTLNYMNKKALITFKTCGSKITSMDYNFGDTSIAAGTTNGKIYTFSIQLKKVLQSFSLPSPQVISQVKYHHVRKGILAVSSHDGHVTVWDTNFNSIESKFADHAAQCMGIVFSPLNKHFMATVGFDYCVFCYDFRAKRQVLKATIPSAGTSVDCHKNGNILAVSTVNGTVCIFDLRNTRAPIKKNVTKGRTIKLMYQLEPDVGDSRKSSTSKASSLERLVHKRNSTESTPHPSVTPITVTCISTSEESQSSDDSSLVDNIFSPIAIKSPLKLTKEILSYSSLSTASKTTDMKCLSLASSKKESPGGHSLTCNNSEEFIAGLLRAASKNRVEFGNLGSITETPGEGTKFLKSADDLVVPKTPQMPMSNGHLKDSEVPGTPKRIIIGSPKNVQNVEAFESPKESGISDNSDVIEEVLSTSNQENEDELSEVDTSDLLNKYSMSKELGKECDATISHNSTVDLSADGKDVAVVQAQELCPISPVEEEEAKGEACAIPMSSEWLSSLKEHMDAKFLEQIDTVHTNLTTIHRYNIFMHSKHEIMLEKILQILEEQTSVEKVDKCVGTG